MIVQDSLTGYFHEVPDHNVAGYGGYGQVVYDGLGNPVGFSLNPASWISTAVDAVKGVASNIPIVGGMVSNMIPGSPAAPPMPYPYPQAQPYPYPQMQPYQDPQVPPNMPSEDMMNSMSPQGFPNSPWSGWRRRSYWRGHGRYRNWSRGWGRSHGFGRGLWRAGRSGFYSHFPMHHH